MVKQVVKERNNYTPSGLRKLRRRLKDKLRRHRKKLRPSEQRIRTNGRNGKGDLLGI